MTLFQIFFELQFKWSVTLLQFPVVCELYPVLFLTSQHLSPLLVLGFTVERYISVCHPFQRERYCTTRRAVAVIGGLVTLALLVNSVQGYFWHYDRANKICDLREEVRDYPINGQRHSQTAFAVLHLVTLTRLRPLVATISAQTDSHVTTDSQVGSQ